MAASKSPRLRLLHMRDEIDNLTMEETATVDLPELRLIILRMLAEFKD